MKPHKIIHSKRKTIALQINENAELIVRAPRYVSKRRINQFIQNKMDWIEKTIEKAEKRKKAIHSNNEFKDGKLIWFLGKNYSLLIQKSMCKINISGEHLLFPESGLKSPKELLTSWYKVQAKSVIAPRCMNYAEKLNLKVNKVGITSAQKRWGSCNSKGNINFSYRLIMAPPEVIDYVIVHELMHLKEMNHSSRFWTKVEQIIPDYKQKRKWLKENHYKFII